MCTNKENILLCHFHSTLQFAKPFWRHRAKSKVWGFSANTRWKGKDVIPRSIQCQPSNACIKPPKLFREIWSVTYSGCLLILLPQLFMQKHLLCLAAPDLVLPSRPANPIALPMCSGDVRLCQMETLQHSHRNACT